MKSSLFIKQLFGSIVFYSAIFFSAGRLNYWQGIIYVFIGFIMTILNYTIFSIDDDLLKERSKPGEGVKSWDKIILGLSFLNTIAMFMVAGFDSGRYHLSPPFHWSLYFIGIFFTIFGQLIFLIAQKQNKFFSSTIRIQTDRCHKVCNTGLYKYVRHPAYLGSIIQSLGFPLFFGSLWSFIPIFISILLLIIRTNLEDITLNKELIGYKDYTQKTKYKLFPFLW